MRGCWRRWDGSLVEGGAGSRWRIRPAGGRLAVCLWFVRLGLGQIVVNFAVMVCSGGPCVGFLLQRAMRRPFDVVNMCDCVTAARLWSRATFLDGGGRPRNVSITSVTLAQCCSVSQLFNCPRLFFSCVDFLVNFCHSMILSLKKKQEAKSCKEEKQGRRSSPSPDCGRPAKAQPKWRPTGAADGMPPWFATCSYFTSIYVH